MLILRLLCLLLKIAEVSLSGSGYLVAHALKSHSYLQIGDNDTASLLLEERKKNVAKNLNSENIGLSDLIDLIDLIIEEMSIALYEDNLDFAIQHLKKAMDKGYIIGYNYRKEHIYMKLRQHPEWQAIFAESNRRAVIQREIYLKLVAEVEKAN